MADMVAGCKLCFSWLTEGCLGAKLRLKLGKLAWRAKLAVCKVLGIPSGDSLFKVTDCLQRVRHAGGLRVVVVQGVVAAAAA